MKKRATARPYRDIAASMESAGEGGDFELGAGAGTEPIASGVAEQIEGKHGDGGFPSDRGEVVETRRGFDHLPGRLSAICHPCLSVRIKLVCLTFARNQII